MIRFGHRVQLVPKNEVLWGRVLIMWSAVSFVTGLVIGILIG